MFKLFNYMMTERLQRLFFEICFLFICLIIAYVTKFEILKFGLIIVSFLVFAIEPVLFVYDVVNRKNLIYKTLPLKKYVLYITHQFAYSVGIIITGANVLCIYGLAMSNFNYNLLIYQLTQVIGDFNNIYGFSLVVMIIFFSFIIAGNIISSIILTTRLEILASLPIAWKLITILAESVLCFIGFMFCLNIIFNSSSIEILVIIWGMAAITSIAIGSYLYTKTDV